jgi:nucleoside-diphosphate-sugar epimerase
MEGPELGRQVTQRELPLGLTSTDRVAITGANGWLGREIIHQLQELAPEVEILALGSQVSELRLGDYSPIAINQWSATNVEQWAPTLFLHLAFLTKERMEDMSTVDYIAANRSISHAALKAFEWPSIRGVVVASSGAALTQTTEPYGALKASDEADFSEAGRRYNIPTVVARAWSLSGEFCTKPSSFMLFSLIAQALDSTDRIRIRADHEVLRRYVDAGEYLRLCLAAAAHGWTGTVDSTGELIEARELAELVQRVLGTSKPVHRPEIVGEPDRYESSEVCLANLAEAYGDPLTGLESQIRISMQAISVSTLNSSVSESREVGER